MESRAIPRRKTEVVPQAQSTWAFGAALAEDAAPHRGRRFAPSPLLRDPDPPPGLLPLWQRLRRSPALLAQTARAPTVAAPASSGPAISEIPPRCYLPPGPPAQIGGAT